MSVLTWEARGKDTEGADTWIGVTLGVTFLVTKSRATGVRLYKLEGTSKVLVGVGFNNPEAAKAQAARMVTA